MSITYSDLVEILAVSQDQVARGERFETFQRAVSFYMAKHALEFPPGGRGVFLIAGTNGKGTTAKTLETLLSVSRGRSGRAPVIGLYTSPHLLEPTERIRSGGSDLSPSEMVRVWDLIEPTVSQFNLSHFEILTLMMIEVFFGDRIRPRVDLAVIEVGVGGRLDPTRVVPHEYAAVTSIGLDHEAILGLTTEAIAREKFAICEGARVAVIAPQVLSAAPLAFASAQRDFVSTTFRVARIYESEVRTPEANLAEAGSHEPVWILKTPYGEAKLNLLGERAVANTSMALEILKAADFSEDEVSKLLPALSTVQWHGRMEAMQFSGRTVYLSGDHNEQGVASLVELLRSFSYDRLWLIVGVGKGKPLEKMLAQYLEIPRAEVLLTLTSFRALALSDLEPWRERVRSIESDPMTALRSTVQLAGSRDLVVVSGSLYLVGDLSKRISALVSIKV